MKLIPPILLAIAFVLQGPDGGRVTEQALGWLVLLFVAVVLAGSLFLGLRVGECSSCTKAKAQEPRGLTFSEPETAATVDDRGTGVGGAA